MVEIETKEECLEEIERLINKFNVTKKDINEKYANGTNKNNANKVRIRLIGQEEAIKLLMPYNTDSLAGTYKASATKTYIWVDYGNDSCSKINTPLFVGNYYAKLNYAMRGTPYNPTGLTCRVKSTNYNTSYPAQMIYQDNLYDKPEIRITNRNHTFLNKYTMADDNGQNSNYIYKNSRVTRDGSGVPTIVPGFFVFMT